MKKLFTLVLAGTICAGSIASAAVFTVTNVNNDGAGSLRQAILNANTNPGPDTINFNIPGSGVQTIAPTNALPDITNAVFINGFSQPGSSANSSATADNSVHLIRLDGYKCLTSSAAGLSFAPASAFAPSAASGSTVRGLVIVRFAYGIKINEASSVTIAGNWIGMDVDGIARGTSSHGIDINSFFNNGFNNVIGGTTPADRNVISGDYYGVWIQGNSDNTVVQGNFIGTDPTGTLPRGNQFGGIYLFTSSNIIIGGTNAAARNIISATTSAGGSGVGVQGGASNFIQGNYIGSDVSGQYDLGNLYDGIALFSANGTRISGNLIVNNRANGINLGGNGNVIENNLIGTGATGPRPLGNAAAGITISGSTNRVGGLGAGQANAIFFNGGAGVEVTSASAVANEISANQIYDNGGLAIDLTPAGINTNDVLDADSGANGLQNFPLLTGASNVFSSLSVSGTLNSQAGATYRLEFFATPAWDAANIPEGEIFLGSTNVTTDGSGNVSFNAAFATAPATNLLITATATDASGNTSEFSAGTGIVSNGVASPSLAIANSVSGGGGGGGATPTITVAWPSDASFYALEQAGSLTPPVQWQTVTSGIVDAAGTRTFTTTNAGAITNQFFRLKKP